MEMIQEALIIQSNGLRTTAFIVENLPGHFIYHQTKKMMPLDEYSERMVPAFIRNDKNERVYTNEMIDALNPGIELDGAGSGAFIFNEGNGESDSALKAIDEYIEKQIIDPALRMHRVAYALQPGVPSSNPKPYSQIPRVRLPELVSPSVTPMTGQASASPSFRKEMSDETKAKLRENLIKARAARVPKNQTIPTI